MNAMEGISYFITVILRLSAWSFVKVQNFIGLTIKHTDYRLTSRLSMARLAALPSACLEFGDIALNINIYGAGYKEGLSCFSPFSLPENIGDDMREVLWQSRTRRRRAVVSGRLQPVSRAGPPGDCCLVAVVYREYGNPTIKP